MGKEKMFGFLMVVVSILSVAFLLQMMMTEADPDNPKWQDGEAFIISLMIRFAHAHQIVFLLRKNAMKKLTDY